jgi:hypothetical protein
MVSAMLEGYTSFATGRLACTCPVCDAPLAPAPVRAGQLHTDFRRLDVAHQVVLDHLTQAHASVLEYSTVLAIGALVVAGAHICETVFAIY